MKKERLEALSDGVFSIAMTLLVIDIKVPNISGTHLTNAELFNELIKLIPLFGSYYISFTVLAMFWISHHAFFHSFTKTINRALVLINMLYLCLLAFIPFSANLLGEYSYSEVAVMVYGCNILAIGITSAIMLHYAIYSKEIENGEISSRTMKQARIRTTITPLFALLGICVSFMSIPLSLILYAFPIVFNIIPGSINFLEKLFGFTLK